MSILGVAFFCKFGVEFERNYTRRKLWKESMFITARTVAGKVVFQGVNARMGSKEILHNQMQLKRLLCQNKRLYAKANDYAGLGAKCSTVTDDNK